MTDQITIQIAGVKGEGPATFDAQTWECMGAAARVLAIHEQRRDLTNGQPFDVIGLRRATMRH